MVTAANQPILHRLVERIGEGAGPDPVAEALARAVREAIDPGALKDALSGRWLGHALHPLLTDVPIGCWTSATLLDLLGGRRGEGSADLLLAVGVVTALPTAVTGAIDWGDTTIVDERVRRVGLVHAAVNVAALTCFSASITARRSGRRRAGRVLGLAGMAALAAGGHLGGHLSYARGVGVDRTTFLQQPQEWVAALQDANLGEGVVTRIEVEGMAVVLTRQDGRVYALAARCAHRGGPLDEGQVEDGCVTCPWHGSIFRLADGAVERGPSAYPQPAFDVRVNDGRIEIRAGERQRRLRSNRPA